jgi:integrase
MANKDGHRRFGNVRRLSSGRYQVRFPAPDGSIRTGPQTFARKAEADRYLTMVEAQMVRREWIDPERGKVALKEYAERWISERPKLRPRTVALYRQLLRTHIAPRLGATPIAALDTSAVRAWRADLLARGTSQTVTAKAYRLLRAVLNTAVREDELIRVNPCRIPGADREDTAERPVLSVAQVYALADEMPKRFRALILLTTFGCLRWGEVTALRRRDLDAVKGTVRVSQALSERQGGGLEFGPPKSRAGLRTVALPAALLPELTDHLSTYVADAPDALLFTGPSKAHPALRRNNFRKLVGWTDATTKIGAPGLHFHDLRHTGNTLAAQTGASLRDLMTRMGHDSTRAALIYQHASADADRAIAEALSAALSTSREPAQSKRQDDGGGAGDDDDEGNAGVLARAG